MTPENRKAVHDPESAPFWRENVQEIAQRLQHLIGAEVWPPCRYIKAVNALIPEIQRRAQAYMDALKPLKSKNYPNGWHEAFMAADSITFKAYEEAQPAREEFSRLTSGGQEQPEDEDSEDEDSWLWSEIDWAACDAAAWEGLENKPGANPFLACFSLFELGAVAIGFGLVNGEEKLLVDFPLRGKYEGYVACLAFGDGGPGDKEVRYYHDRAENCSENRLTRSYRRGIKVSFMYPARQQDSLG